MSPEPKPSAPTCSRRWRTVPLRELGLKLRAQAWYRRPLRLERLGVRPDGSPLWLVLEGASLIWSRTPRRASLRPAQQQRPPSPVAPLVRPYGPDALDPQYLGSPYYPRIGGRRW